MRGTFVPRRRGRGMLDRGCRNVPEAGGRARGGEPARLEPRRGARRLGTSTNARNPGGSSGENDREGAGWSTDVPRREELHERGLAGFENLLVEVLSGEVDGAGVGAEQQAHEGRGHESSLHFCRDLGERRDARSSGARFRKIRRLARSRKNVPIVERRRNGDRARVGGRASAAPRDGGNERRRTSSRRNTREGRAGIRTGRGSSRGGLSKVTTR